MRRRISPFVALAVIALGSGCTLYGNAIRNFINEPCLAWEERAHRKRARSMARDAWAVHPQCFSASDDYADGFVDGYADHLEAGGPTEPEPAPPSRYQKTVVHTPATLRAGEDYFAGFHAGALAAHASGQRRLMVVPVAMPARSTESPVITATLPIEPLPPPRTAGAK